MFSLAPTEWLDDALAKLLRATLENEQAMASRDLEIAAVQQKWSPSLAKSHTLVTNLTAQIEAHYLKHRAALEPAGSKSLQLAHGLVGMRSATNPALIPLDDKWTWDRIARKVKSVWRTRFFHKPKPPAIDKTKIKKELTPEQLAKVGLKLDDSENFFIDLNRLAPAEKQEAAA